MSIIANGLNPNELLKHTLNRALNGRKMYEYFMNAFYELHEGTNNVPDIGGYYMIYLIPPKLSGLIGGTNPTAMSHINRKILPNNKAVILYAQSISLPGHQIQLGTIKSQSDIAMPFATGVFRSGSMSITFMDTQNLDMFYLHHLWADYIESVLYDDITPQLQFIDGCIIDYATSAYILKFKNDMANPIYIGKASGIILEGMPHNEIIGTRTGPELTSFTVNYNCTSYVGVVLGDDATRTNRGNNLKKVNPRNGHIIDEFNTELLTLYS